jgi:hypothetical protein
VAAGEPERQLAGCELLSPADPGHSPNVRGAGSGAEPGSAAAPTGPDEDDGHDLSGLILRQVADAITGEYAPDQVVTFLGEEGIPPDWLSLPEGPTDGNAHAVLAAVWRAGSMGRHLVRHFLGRWLDGQLITGPDSELQATLREQLARQGWQVRPEDSVLAG